MAGFDMSIPGLKNFVGLGNDDKVDFTGISSLSGVNPYEMDQLTFNNWAESNPLDASKLGELGYRPTDTNLGNATSGGFSNRNIQTGLGVAQLGLGVAGYLDNRKTAKLQRENLGVQIESNRNLLATRKARAKDISRTFGLGA